MRHKKAKKAGKKSRNAIRASVRKEMAKPRMARSARIAEQKLDHSRVPEQASGTVEKIIPHSRLRQPGKK